MGQLLTFLSAFRLKGGESQIKIADRESILKKYGDKRLLAKTMAEKEFERISAEKENTKGIRSRVRTDNNAGAGSSNSKSANTTQEVKSGSRENQEIEKE